MLSTWVCCPRVLGEVFFWGLYVLFVCADLSVSICQGRLVLPFLSDLNCVVSSGPVSMDKVHYCERFIELLIDLEVRHKHQVLFFVFLCFKMIKRLSTKSSIFFLIHVNLAKCCRHHFQEFVIVLHIYQRLWSAVSL